MKVRQRVSGFVASCLVLAVAATPFTPGAGIAHVASGQAHLSFADVPHVAPAGSLRASLSGVPRGPHGQRSQFSAATTGLEKAPATLAGIAGAGLSSASGAALALLGAFAAYWLLGFIRRSSRTRGQPRGGALAL